MTTALCDIFRHFFLQCCLWKRLRFRSWSISAPSTSKDKTRASIIPLNSRISIPKPIAIIEIENPLFWVLYPTSIHPWLYHRFKNQNSHHQVCYIAMYILDRATLSNLLYRTGERCIQIDMQDAKRFSIFSTSTISFLSYCIQICLDSGEFS